MGGAKHLSWLVPQPLVRLLHLTGEPMAAEEFVRYGGELTVVPRERLLDEAYALESGYEYEQGLTCELSGHADAKEAVNAVLERRAPNYMGS